MASGGTSIFQELEEMEDSAMERTLKSLAALHLNQPLCITLPNIGGDFELKSDLFHLLPFFVDVQVKIFMCR